MELSIGCRFDMSASALSPAAFGNEPHGFGCEEEEALWERWGRPDSSSCDAATQVALRPYGGMCLYRGSDLDVVEEIIPAVLIENVDVKYWGWFVDVKWSRQSVMSQWDHYFLGLYEYGWVIFSTIVSAGAAPLCQQIIWRWCWCCLVLITASTEG